jgi:hypothetical protein
MQRAARPVDPPGPGGRYKDLGQGHRACAQRLWCRLGEHAIGSVMVRIVSVEMCDQHTPVENDHAGQSRRRSSRYFGP